MAQDRTRAVEALEFWPDYGPGPLWNRDGKAADLDALRLPGDLAQRLAAFNGSYEEDRLPLEGTGDAGYLAVGLALLAEVREALAGRYRVIVTEPWWEDPPTREKG